MLDNPKNVYYFLLYRNAWASPMKTPSDHKNLDLKGAVEGSFRAEGFCIKLRWLDCRWRAHNALYRSRSIEVHTGDLYDPSNQRHPKILIKKQ